MSREKPSPEDIREAARILRAVAETETDGNSPRDGIIRAELRGAAEAFAAEVESGAYPDAAHTFDA